MVPLMKPLIGGLQKLEMHFISTVQFITISKQRYLQGLLTPRFYIICKNSAQLRRRNREAKCLLSIRTTLRSGQKLQRTDAIRRRWKCGCAPNHTLQNILYQLKHVKEHSSFQWPTILIHLAV